MGQISCFEPKPHLAVAVSGGSDSMALCLLAHEWAAMHEGSVTAITIDHGLRAESETEAKQVNLWLKERNIPHHILTITDNLTHNIQHLAREKRYALLAEFCKRNHILHLLTAHHQDDQIETFFLNLTRGSGIDGLSSMPMIREYQGIRLLRPLLGISKNDLRKYLSDQWQHWIEDPSNASSKYTRNRMRYVLAKEIDPSFNDKRILDTIAHQGRARQALEHCTADALAQCAQVFPEGYAALSVTSWEKEHEEIRLRILAALLTCVNGTIERPRFDSLKRLSDLMRYQDFKGTTLHGCHIAASKKKDAGGIILITSIKPHAASVSAQIGDDAQWDRFIYHLELKAADTKDYTVGVLGADAARFRNEFPAKHLLATILKTLPALRKLEEIISIPHIGYHHESFKDIIFQAHFAPAKPLAAATFSTTLITDHL